MTVVKPLNYIEKIPSDEPVFILRAKDNFFETAVRAWIREAVSMGVSEEKIDGVKSILVEGTTWQMNNPEKCKIPD